MPATIEVAIEWNDDVVIVRMKGEMGLQNADSVERQFLPVVASKPRLAVIDMTNLEFIGSLGLGMLVELQRGVVRNGGEMFITNAQQMIVDVMRRCRLDTVFKLKPSVEDAIAAAQVEPAE